MTFSKYRVYIDKRIYTPYLTITCKFYKAYTQPSWTRIISSSYDDDYFRIFLYPLLGHIVQNMIQQSHIYIYWETWPRVSLKIKEKNNGKWSTGLWQYNIGGYAEKEKNTETKTHTYTHNHWSEICIVKLTAALKPCNTYKYILFYMHILCNYIRPSRKIQRS